MKTSKQVVYMLKRTNTGKNKLRENQNTRETATRDKLTFLMFQGSQQGKQPLSNLIKLIFINTHIIHSDSWRHSVCV